MSGFLYYIPDVKDSHPVHEGKLSYAFEGQPASRRCYKGPDGVEGVVFGTEKLGYFADQQTWQDVPFLECWIGFYCDEPPQESDLRRKATLLGRSLEINGQQWQIPVARSFELIDGNPAIVSRLSQYIQVDYSTGEWMVGEVQKEYRKLWEAALRYWDYWSQVNLLDEDDKTEGPQVELAHGEVLEMTELAMATNYRMSRVEMSLLELLSGASCTDIMSIVIDITALDELLLKKKVTPPVSSVIDNGKPAETKAIPQPSLTG